MTDTTDTTDGSDDFAAWLRALPVAGSGLPDLDLDALPADPVTLVRERVREAADAGVPAPHAMTLATSDDRDEVSARTLILKDAVEDRLCFATSRLSYKGRQLAANPRAALVLCWPSRGDQLRAWGPVVDLGDEAARRDLAARSVYSRATCLTGHQGEELDDLETQRSAWATALERVRAEPDLEMPDWRAYAVVVEGAEWWHTSGHGQVRVAYQREGAGWRRFLRWP